MEKRSQQGEEYAADLLNEKRIVAKTLEQRELDINAIIKERNTVPALAPKEAYDIVIDTMNNEDKALRALMNMDVSTLSDNTATTYFRELRNALAAITAQEIKLLKITKDRAANPRLARTYDEIKQLDQADLEKLIAERDRLISSMAPQTAH